MYIVYSKPNCTFCEQSKNLLKAKGIDFTEIYFDVGQSKEPGKTYVAVPEFKAQFPQAKTAPQILYRTDSGDEYVGGFTELRARVESST